MTRDKVSTAGRAAADRLREDILTVEDGAFIGTEAELMQEYGFSIPTFRQAVRLLEYEQLLRGKRGLGGGYYARKPNIDAVAHLGAVVLRSKNAGSMDNLEAFAPLFQVAVQRAVDCKAVGLRRELESMAQARPGRALSSAEVFLDEEIALVRHILKMSASPTIEFLVGILLEVTAVNQRVRLYRPLERRVKGAKLRRQLIVAILAHDGRRAALTVNLIAAALQEWRMDDAAGGASHQSTRVRRRQGDKTAPARAPQRDVAATKAKARP